MLKRWNFYVGILLILAALWGILNRIGWWDHYYFSFAWTGYFFFIDAIAFARWKTSLLTRLKFNVLPFFILSIPFWHCFGILNMRFHLWTTGQLWGTFESELFYTIAHSTVMPSFFATLYLFMPRVQSLIPDKILSRGATAAWVSSGLFSLALVVFYPHLFFPLTFCFIPLILDPINYHLGRPSLLFVIKSRNWKVLGAFVTTGLITGFFWESFNAVASGGWSYKLPYFNFARVFSMPILGFLGYVPFGISMFSFYYWFETMIIDGAKKIE